MKVEPTEDVKRCARYMLALIERGYQPPGNYLLAGLVYPACYWPREGSRAGWTVPG